MVRLRKLFVSGHGYRHGVLPRGRPRGGSDEHVRRVRALVPRAPHRRDFLGQHGRQEGSQVGPVGIYSPHERRYVPDRMLARLCRYRRGSAAAASAAAHGAVVLGGRRVRWRCHLHRGVRAAQSSRVLLLDGARLHGYGPARRLASGHVHVLRLGEPTRPSSSIGAGASRSGWRFPWATSPTISVPIWRIPRYMPKCRSA